MTDVQTLHTVHRGEFVSLRPLAVDDAALTLAWRRSDRARLLNAGAGSVEAQAAWIARRPADELNFIIEINGPTPDAPGRPIGMLSLVQIDLDVGSAEAGRFLIGDAAAARGVPAAAEAIAILYRLAFDALGLQRLHGVTAASNTLMIKWHAHLGMREEGRLRRHVRIDGKLQDLVCLGLLEEEYRSIALPRLRALIAMGRPRPASSQGPAQGPAAPSTARSKESP